MQPVADTALQRDAITKSEDHAHINPAPAGQSREARKPARAYLCRTFSERPQLVLPKKQYLELPITSGSFFKPCSVCEKPLNGQSRHHQKNYQTHEHSIISSLRIPCSHCFFFIIRNFSMAKYRIFSSSSFAFFLGSGLFSGFPLITVSFILKFL